MDESQKQALHIEGGKSFSQAEANENERRWDAGKFERLNENPTNNYDRTRSHLNFEVGGDGKIHTLGYQARRLDERLQQRLQELEFRPFKPGSKNQPNICAKIIIAGNHERTMEMAFGSQTVNAEKGADNSHLHRCREVEEWAIDSYRWCCDQFGQENVIGFQVHLDEKSPHCHALVVPVGIKGKQKKLRVMWAGKFGTNGTEYKNNLLAMHTSLYEQVGRKYGLERGESVEGRNVRHLDKKEYFRELAKLEKAIKGLSTMKQNLEASIDRLRDEVREIHSQLADRKISLSEADERLDGLEKEISDLETKRSDKLAKLEEKRQELSELMRDVGNVKRTIVPFKNHRVDITAPQITETPPTFGRENWLKEQNKRLEKAFNEAVDHIESLYLDEAQRQVAAAQENQLIDYNNYHALIDENRQLNQTLQTLSDNFDRFRVSVIRIFDVLAVPDLRERLFTIADALIGGRPIPLSAVGGGGDSSDLRWDGRRPDEEEDAYRYRCLIKAVSLVTNNNAFRRKR